MNPSTAVTVLGLGNMGAALAHALLNRGHNVTVWNRTSERAAPLVAKGAILARSPAEALVAGGLILMCVIDYTASEAILDSPGVVDCLSGKTLIQFSTGSTDQVYAQQRRVRAHGGRFIAGGLMVFPRGIGQPNTVIVYAGDSEAFEEHRPILTSLGGTLSYLGADPCAATGAFAALATYSVGAFCLFYETAAIARHFGLSMNTYYSLTRLVADTLQEGLLMGARQVVDQQFDGDQASVEVALSSVQEFRQTFEQTGIPAFMTEGIIEQLELASARGYGGKEMAQVVEVLWAHHRRAEMTLPA